MRIGQFRGELEGNENVDPGDGSNGVVKIFARQV
jgi:hypothetical protein